MSKTVESVLDIAGTGPFQRKLLAIFGLVWAADAMQVLAVGFTAASIAESFSLTLPEALQTGTLFFLGMLIGAAGFGRLADRFGRRRVLLITVAIDALFGILSAFAPNFAILLVLRFITGMAVGGTLPVDYAMMAEFLPARSRGRWLVMLEGFWALGTVLIALTAWCVSLWLPGDGWRVIFAVAAIPALVGIWFRPGIPESPLYLQRTGRSAELKQVLDLVLAKNGKPTLPADETIAPMPVSAAEGIFSAGLRRRTLAVLSIWFLVSLAYYGIFTWMPARLAGDGVGDLRGHGFLVIMALAQLPGYALAAWGVEAIGRRRTLIGFLLLSAAGCALFFAATSVPLTAAALLVLSFSLLGTWGALYAFTPELYPTASRGTGMGTAGAFARLGGLLAPSILAALFAVDMPTTIAGLGLCLLLAAVAAFLIDVETRRAALT
ncbi:MFS transporter [Nostoc sp. 3335mG]|nr:MFS transporter [Nostoc sp. 3335mG]